MYCIKCRLSRLLERENWTDPCETHAAWKFKALVLIQVSCLSCRRPVLKFRAPNMKTHIIETPPDRAVKKKQ